MTLIVFSSTILYLTLGMIFVHSIKLRNKLYRNLVLYYYNWTEHMQKVYLIYMQNSVILFWPMFFIVLMLDKIVNFVNKNKNNA